MDDQVKDLGCLNSPASEAEIFETLLAFIKENPASIGFAVRWTEPAMPNRFITYDRSRRFSMITTCSGITLYYDLSLAGIEAISKGANPTNHARIQILHVQNPTTM